MTVYECDEKEAAKKYRCDECQQRITPGDQYQYIRGCERGVWFKQRYCLPCWSLVCRRDREGGPVNVSLREWITGYFRDAEIVDDRDLLRFMVRDFQRRQRRAHECGDRQTIRELDRIVNDMLELLKVAPKED